MGNEAIEDVLSQAAAILGNQDDGYDGPGLGKVHIFWEGHKILWKISTVDLTGAT